MNGRRAVVGLCMLCALLVSAFAAQGASAAGTTAYTCVTGIGGTLRGEHCLTTGTESAIYGHKSITNNVTTELTGNNETTKGVKDATLLKSTIAGAAFTLTGATTTGTGWMTNAEEGGEMFAHGEGTITYTGVTASGGCKVFTDSGAGKGEEGVIHTEPLVATTKGQGDALKFEPKTPNVFARFLLEGCTNPGLNGTYTVTGTIKSTTIDGATTNFTHANTTTQNTLKLNGVFAAGIEGTLTLKSRLNGTESFTPLSATT
jgi:hypothetical protein